MSFSSALWLLALILAFLGLYDAYLFMVAAHEGRLEWVLVVAAMIEFAAGYVATVLSERV